MDKNQVKRFIKEQFDSILFLINIITLTIPIIKAIIFSILSFNLMFIDSFILLLFILLFFSVNTINIFLLITKRSALFPLLNMILYVLIFLILSFLNLVYIISIIFMIISIIFTVKKRNIIPKFRTRKSFYILSVIIILLITPIITHFSSSIFTISVPAHANPDFRVSFYCEFYHNNTFTDQHLIALRDHNSRIFLAINESEINNNSLALNMTRRLNAANISVYAWLLLNQSNGYWAADTNVMEFNNLVNNFINWSNDNSLEYDGIMIDSEPDYNRLNSLMYQIKSLNIFGALIDLKSQAVSTEHIIAQEEYQRIARTIQDEGFEAMVVGFPLILDDQADNDDTIQRLMGVSTMPPYNWNYSSFMIYRTTFREILTVDLGSYMIYSYGNTIKKYFSYTSSVSLSRCGVSPYNNIDQFIHDAYIVKNLGFNEVIWWEFPLFINEFGITGLNTFLDSMELSRSVSFNYSPFTLYFRLFIAIIDEIEII
ncbi:MAG: hypothetical protein GF329_06575 [Candidatus Lokiarchaeota archaeon]|nr:hypothetical protein [Candidatus Lokiarchaeota archaeon]